MNGQFTTANPDEIGTGTELRPHPPALPAISALVWAFWVPARVDRTDYKAGVLLQEGVDVSKANVVYESVIWPPLPYGLDEDNTFRALSSSQVLNARLGYRMVHSMSPAFSAEVFARVDNLTDEVVLPQLGLPDPGREIRLGLEVSL